MDDRRAIALPSYLLPMGYVMRRFRADAPLVMRNIEPPIPDVPGPRILRRCQQLCPGCREPENSVDQLVWRRGQPANGGSGHIGHVQPAADNHEKALAIR